MLGSKLRKPDHVKALQKELSTNINKYKTLSLTLGVPVATPAETPAVAQVKGPSPMAAAAAPVVDPTAALMVVQSVTLAVDQPPTLAPAAALVAGIVTALAAAAVI